MPRFANRLLVLLLALLAVWWIMRAPPPELGSRVAQPAKASAEPAVASAPRLSSSPAAAMTPDPDRSTLLDALNQPGGTIQSDLRLLHEVFAAWQTNFPREGNPVGENAEITRALTGGNPLRLALVPRDHPAINAAGELTDRWGTAYRFHQLSGTRMEIRSAGADRRFGTEDDAVLTP